MLQTFDFFPVEQVMCKQFFVCLPQLLTALVAHFLPSDEQLHLVQLRKGGGFLARGLLPVLAVLGVVAVERLRRNADHFVVLLFVELSEEQRAAFVVKGHVSYRDLSAHSVPQGFVPHERRGNVVVFNL